MAVIKAGNRGKKGTLITPAQAGAAEGEAIDNLIIHENNTKAIEQAFNQALAVSLEEIGLAAERFAKGNLTRNHSVDTGRLRNSITHVIATWEDSVYVGTNVEYGPYVEEGTSRSDPKPYLLPAATEHGDFYRNIYKKHLEDA